MRKIAAIFATWFLASTTAFADVHGDQGFSRALDIHREYSKRPDLRIIRTWSGDEKFCVAAQKESFVAVQEFLATLNAAYDTNFDVIKVREFAECPEVTSFFVFVESAVTPVQLASVVEAIHGSPPPLRLFQEGLLLGLSLSIPGKHPREFVYFDASISPLDNNASPSTSIMLEELLHSITRLGDFPSREVHSLLGENTHVRDYGGWFNVNPVGLCETDLFLLGIAIGPIIRNTNARTVSIDWVSQQKAAIKKTVAEAKRELSEYLDPRCT